MIRKEIRKIHTLQWTLSSFIIVGSLLAVVGSITRQPQMFSIIAIIVFTAYTILDSIKEIRKQKRRKGAK